MPFIGAASSSGLRRAQCTVEYLPMECRAGCGACCIAPSISSPIPGMPDGKPAGVRCVQLTPDNRCRLFGLPGRPAVCRTLRPGREMCGDSAAEALELLSQLELATRPGSPAQMKVY